MSLVTLSHVCSHLQNASKARLGLTSVPSTNLILQLMLSMHAAGFVANVHRGGPHPPPITGAGALAHSVSEPVTQENVASRRLWLQLKYWNNHPVISAMSMVSKPTKRVWLDAPSLTRIVKGFEAGYVRGLTRTGECLFVSTDRGIMEARECVEKKIGGMLLCRVH
ncbi:MAG: hypothetical protein M1829_004495 [Trizodia sp. TS-e1964]|nr:MAG: hypothetical protein M1829_004495 [Trizodia sp. TS-e1964]